MSATTLAQVIMAQTIPNHSLGVIHPGNWPCDAEFAVEYLCVDRQFDVSANRERNIEYFTNVAEYNQWVDDKKEWIMGTDYDFSISGKVYMWDWGPQYVKEINL